MTVSQASFRAALLDADAPTPHGLTNALGGPAGARFSVYRNNVVVSLSDALSTAFPLVRMLVGTETFEKLAAIFVRDNPPTSPLMMFYGDRFPEFLENFGPLQHIGYLPDCAHLDLAMRHSYHAKDAAPFDATQLASGNERALSQQMALAPATRIIRSPWPLYDIWRFNMVASAPKPTAGAQDVLITRPEFDPHPHLLPTGTADWLEELNNGLSFGEATEKTMAETPDFDLAQALSLALTTHALVDYTTKEH